MPVYRIVWLRVAPCSDWCHDDCMEVRVELRRGEQRRVEKYPHNTLGELEGLLDALLDRADDAGAQLTLLDESGS